MHSNFINTAARNAMLPLRNLFLLLTRDHLRLVSCQSGGLPSLQQYWPRTSTLLRLSVNASQLCHVRSRPANQQRDATRRDGQANSKAPDCPSGKWTSGLTCFEQVTAPPTNMALHFAAPLPASRIQAAPPDWP